MWNRRTWSGLKRAFAWLLLLGVAACVSSAQLIAAGPRQPWWIPSHWTEWFQANPQGALLLTVSAVSAGAGLALSIFQVWFSQSARLAAAGILAEISTSREQSAEGHAITRAQLAALLEQVAALRAERGIPPDPQAERREEAALESVAASDAPDLASAREAIRAQDPEALVDALIASASRDSAERLRKAGALAFGFNTRKATLAYERAAAVDPADVWTYIFLSRLHQRTGDIAAARKATNAALGAALSQRDRMVALNELGDVAARAGDLADARNAFAEGLEIGRRLAARDDDDAEAQRDLSISYNKIGDVAARAGDLAGARDAYTKALDIRRRRAARDADRAQAQRDLSVSYNRIGDVAARAGDLAGARDGYTKALDIRRRLAARDADDAQAQRDLSVSYGKIGDSAARAGDLAGAREAHAQALDIDRRLAARDADDGEAQRDLSVSYNKTGDLAARAGDLAGAREAHAEALDIRRRLAARDADDAEAQRDLSISYIKIGDVTARAGDLAGARDAYAQALDISRRLAARDADDAQAQRDLSISLERLGDAADAIGDASRALQFYEESLPIADRLAALGAPDLIADLEITRKRIGELRAKLPPQ